MTPSTAEVKRLRRVANSMAPFERRRVTLVLTLREREAIDRLLALGLFGFTRVDFIRRALDARLCELTEKGWLPEVEYVVAEPKRVPRRRA